MSAGSSLRLGGRRRSANGTDADHRLVTKVDRATLSPARRARCVPRQTRWRPCPHREGRRRKHGGSPSAALVLVEGVVPIRSRAALFKAMLEGCRRQQWARRAQRGRRGWSGATGAPFRRFTGAQQTDQRLPPRRASRKLGIGKPGRRTTMIHLAAPRARRRLRRPAQPRPDHSRAPDARGRSRLDPLRRRIGPRRRSPTMTNGVPRTNHAPNHWTGSEERAICSSQSRGDHKEVMARIASLLDPGRDDLPARDER